MSAPSSGTSTPNPGNQRFTASARTAEELLSTQTVGLVALSDYRKRRAEALELKERAAQDVFNGGGSGIGTPGSATPDGASTPQEQQTLKKKPKRRKVGNQKLSFGVDEDDEADGEAGNTTEASSSRPTPATSPRSGTPNPSSELALKTKTKITANTSVGVIPKALTKSAFLKDMQAREILRKEFLARQEAVKATEILIPFVFYDGTNIPGGVCKVKKGDLVWVFLDRSRKVGAELGVGGDGAKGGSRREWARVGVDDLMLVRGSVIIPHHYDFYYFIINRTLGPNNRLLFNYSSEPPSFSTSTAADNPSSSSTPDLSTFNPLSNPSKSKTVNSKTESSAENASLEGVDDDPTFTKVVDRRWYERNKHIFPASVWQEFDPEKDYQNEVKRDAGGNAFFFS